MTSPYALAVFPPPPPQPASGCGRCTQLDQARSRARAAGDHSRVSDCNVLISLHPHDGDIDTRPRRQR